MDAESLISTGSCLFQAAPAVNPLTSPLSGTFESVFMQEHKGSPMQYPPQTTQIEQTLSQIIITSPDPQTLLSRMAKALGEIFQVDACLIVAGVKSVATTQFALWGATDNPASSGSPRQLLEHPLLTDGLTDVQPLAIPDLQASEIERTNGWDGEVLSARAVLRIHTRFQSLVNGAIVLGRSQPYNWTIPEKELLSVAADSVAIAISQVQLTLQILTATQYQTLLNQLSLAIRSGLDLDEILQMAIAGIARSLQVDRGLLLMLKYTDKATAALAKRDGASPPLTQLSKLLLKTQVTVAREWLEPTADQAARANGKLSKLLNQSFWLSESSLCQQAFKAAPEPIVIGEDISNHDVVSENVSLFDREMMPTAAIVPLVGKQSNVSLGTTVLGFLVLQHHQPRPWLPEELELVKWVSTQVSATIIQNQALRQVQSLVEDRTDQLQQSLEVQEKLYEKTRQQMAQLQELNRLKDEFISSMSHELRTPLTTMSLAIRMLRQPTLSIERREKYLEILQHECNKEIDLINDLLSLQRLESDRSHIQPEKIDLLSLINELADSFEEKWADKRLSLRVDCPVRSLMLDTDPDSLNRILLELLTNAGKYSDPDTTVCLQVAHEVQQSVDRVVLTLTNTGSGISPTDLPHIFERFRRGQGVTQKAVRGTGLGLALVKCLVQQLNGTIEVKSCSAENSQTFLTTFTLTLPQLQQQS